ncbi:MAG: ABC transporter ATP-binding protein [Gemmataceae bacterium]|nr:ABC transporter ATP-binding protein [Gemmataceae bacterium]
MAAILTIDKLRAGYGPIDALHDVSLTVEAGEIVAMIGANGAGKTSTLMSVSGVLKPRAGSIVFQGQDISKLPAHQIVKLGLAQSPEGRKIFPRLTVLENLQMGAFTRNDAPGIAADIEKAFMMFPILKERKGQAGGLLSGGQQQMLAIARALMARPKLLMLDEPSLGLAPQIVVQIFDVIKDLNKAGMSILLVEQNARMALKVAHRGYVLETGRVTMSDAADKLLVDPRVRAAYLGE